MDITAAASYHDRFDETAALPGWNTHVDDNFDPRRSRPVSAWHDRHDRRAQGAGRLRIACRARQGCSYATSRCLLGRYRHADRPIFQCNDDTTIGLVSAGLLTFPQGLGLVFGANVGTTGTGWLVALIGVRVSLTAAALPMIFVGALVKLLGSGRIAGAGAALAGFALVLFGLTTLQEGMGGLAERLHPADLPAVLAAPGAGWWSGMLGVLALVIVGLVMTAVMQSSTASIALTLSAHYAGAVGLDQACALIIGQNIGTATSSALAAIGASTTAKRLAVAYILFKLIAAVIALAVFPIVIPLLVRASNTIDGVTLLPAITRPTMLSASQSCYRS